MYNLAEDHFNDGSIFIAAKKIIVHTNKSPVYRDNKEEKL